MGDWVVESPSFIEQLMSNKIVMLNQNGVNEVVKIIEEKDKEIERLNNIINELENYFNKIKDTSTLEERMIAKYMLKYIKELKGENNE